MSSIRLNRRQFMKATVGAAAALAVRGIAPAQQTAGGPTIRKRPNVLIITTHDSGRHFGCYGVPTVQTPRIDELAAGGVRFSQMYASTPICSPSRGALLTGRYPLANGLLGLSGGSWKWELNDYRQHLSHIMRQAGYRTALFGLQHETAHIDRMGFDDLSGRGVGGLASPQVSAPAVAGKVADFLRKRNPDDPPFYAQVGFQETHTPYDFAGCKPDTDKGVWIPPYARSHDWPTWKVVLRRFGGDAAMAEKHLAEFQGSLRQADQGVGVIMDALAQTGLADDTLVLFNTDHGPEMPGGKWTMYDGGLGIAFIMRWPGGGVTGGRDCKWLLGNVDFLPTLAELTGLQVPDNLQGVSFAQACRQDVTGKASVRLAAYGSWVDGLNFSVRTTDFKLIRNLAAVDPNGRKCPPYELYDLRSDALEMTNLADSPAYAADFASMKTRMDDWLKQMDDPTTHGAIEGATHNDMLADYRKKYEARAAAKIAATRPA